MEFVTNFLIAFGLINVAISASTKTLQIVDREAWNASATPELPEPMINPVPYVIIHHSYLPAACHSTVECKEAMKWMQDLHQLTNGWNDVGYSFAVGGDFKAYEGRGWSSVGAHAPQYNARSIGICVIGDWRTELPPKEQLEVVHELIQKGIDLGMIAKNYTLYGHRQVREGTECPGDALFNEISTWEHFLDIVETRSVRNVKTKA